MSYTLYVANHCTACDEIISYLEKQNINCTVTNVGSHPNLNRTIFITPALCDEGGVLAYGKDDIIAIVTKKNG